MPTSAQEHLLQALKSMADEALRSLPAELSLETVTLRHLFDLENEMAEAAAGVDPMKEFSAEWNLATALRKSNDRTIELWAKQASDACSP